LGISSNTFASENKPYLECIKSGIKPINQCEITKGVSAE
jgi:hypothetical protein